MEDPFIYVEFADLDDLDNYFTSEESLADDEDDYLNNAKINIEPVEETYSSFHQWGHFKSLNECCSSTEKATHENRSEIVSERENQRNTEKTRKVFFRRFLV